MCQYSHVVIEPILYNALQFPILILLIMFKIHKLLFDLQFKHFKLKLYFICKHVPALL